MVEASVIIATYNRAEMLRTCLQALSRQTHPCSEFEVVVVIDGSTDHTRAMLDGLRTPYPLQIVEQDNAGQAAATNRGVEHARGSICIFLDDDIIAVPELVAEHVALHRQRSDAVGIGQLTLKVPSDADWFARRFAQGWSEHYTALDAGRRAPNWLDCFNGNMSVSRTSLERVGGLATLPRGSDVELGYRLEQAGHAIVYLPKALGEQDQRKDARALLQDSEASGTGSVEVCRRHPATLSQLLGRFTEQRPTIAALLRLLLWLDLPPRYITGLAGLIDRASGHDLTYHVLQRYAYWRGVRHALSDHGEWEHIIGGIPMLMYHAFGMRGERATRYVVPIDTFEKQMAWLKHRGYHACSVEELVRDRREHRFPPSRTVVLTIDDGYADAWSLAYPVLRRYGFTATVFLVDHFVGATNRWTDGDALSGRPLMTWENVVEMAQGNIRFGAHSHTHADLTAVPVEAAKVEIETSRDVLEKTLGVPATTFAYPYGKQNPVVEKIVNDAGFQAVCGIQNGLNTLATPLSNLRRVEVQGTDSMLQFALAVRFGARGRALWNRLTRVMPFSSNGKSQQAGTIGS